MGCDRILIPTKFAHRWLQQGVASRQRFGKQIGEPRLERGPGVDVQQRRRGEHRFELLLQRCPVARPWTSQAIGKAGRRLAQSDEVRVRKVDRRRRLFPIVGTRPFGHRPSGNVGCLIQSDRYRFGDRGGIRLIRIGFVERQPLGFGDRFLEGLAQLHERFWIVLGIVHPQLSSIGAADFPNVRRAPNPKDRPNVRHRKSWPSNLSSAS